MNNSHLVYSTDAAITGKRKPRARQAAPPAKIPPPGFPQDGIVRISRERGGRGGKTVTAIRGLPSADLEAHARELRRACGAGGTVRDGVIEIQGDHRGRVRQTLESLGYRVKLAGG